MKWDVRNKTASRWFSLICILHYMYIFHSFIQTILTNSMLCKNQEKGLNLQMWVWLNFKIFFSTLQVCKASRKILSPILSCKCLHVSGPK